MIEIIEGDFSHELELQLAPAIKAGFPSPAEDYIHESLDFNRDIVRHPESTFYGRISGDSMIDAGFNEGDIAVIDRSRQPRNGDVVVAYINNEFTIKYLDLFGAMVGDGCRIGANAVLSPRTLLNPNTIVKRLELAEQDPQ